jgi:transcriptional regulator with XRE-family HTH domain
MAAVRKTRGDTQLRKARALPMLLRGMGYQEIAEELGVTRQAVWDWMQDPEFVAELREQQQSILQETHDILVAASADVGMVFREIALDKAAPPRARVAAAAKFFELLGKHKTAPIQPADDDGEEETEEGTIALLSDYPPHLLEEARKRQQLKRDL